MDQIASQDARVKYLYQENAERGAARNNGFANSVGKYLCFLDSDDHFLKDHLNIVYREIQNKSEEVALFFTNAMMKDQEGNVTERECPDLEKYDTLDYILQYTFNPARVAVHRNIIEELKFDPTIPGLEDLDLWLRIALKSPIYQIKERSILYNLHAETYTVGELTRYEKELKNFKYIFSKPELKDKLRKNSSDRLLSMCHYHLALKADQQGKSGAFYHHAFQSFVLCPSGYNNKTNKPLMVLGLYNIPLLGYLLKKLIRAGRNE